MLAAYLAIVAIGAWLAGNGSPERRGHLLTALAVLQVTLAIWAIAEAVVDPRHRVTTPVGNASDLGVLGVVGFAVLAWYALQRPHWLFWTGAASAAVMVALTASRGAWLGLGIAVLGGFILLLIQRRLRKAWPVAVILAAGVAVVLILPMTRSRSLGTSPLADQTASGRILLWKETLNLWWHHPWLGVGPSHFVDEIGRYHTPQWASLVGPDYPPDSPHNIILQVMASGGLLGLLVAVGAAILLGRTLWKARKDEWTGGAFLALIGAGACYGFHFTDLWNIVPLLLVVGAACGTESPVSSENLAARMDRATGHYSRWLVGTAGVLAVVLGLQAVVTEAMLTNSVSLLKNGQSQGLAMMQKAVRLKPQDPDLAWRAGHALTVLAGDKVVPAQWAIDMLTPACSRLPDSVECMNDLALANIRAGNSAAAADLLHKSLSVDSVNITTLMLMASAQDGLGDQAGAEALLLQATELRPTAPEPWQNLANLYTEEGRTADAEAAQAKADALS